MGHIAVPVGWSGVWAVGGEVGMWVWEWGGGDESSLRKGGMGMRGEREDVLREGCSGKEKWSRRKENK